MLQRLTPCSVNVGYECEVVSLEILIMNMLHRFTPRSVNVGYEREVVPAEILIMNMLRKLTPRSELFANMKFA